MFTNDDTADFYTICMDPDNFKPITLRSRNAGNAQATFTEYTLPRARFKQVTKSIETGSLGRTAKQINTFQIWNDSIQEATAIVPGSPSCPPPKATDILVTLMGTSWTIDRVANTLCQESDAPGNVYNCEVTQTTGPS